MNKVKPRGEEYKHYHFTVGAHNGPHEEKEGHVKEYVKVNVRENSEKEAIDKAKSIVEREEYFVKEVHECLVNHDAREEMQQEHLRLMREIIIQQQNLM